MAARHPEQAIVSSRAAGWSGEQERDAVGGAVAASLLLVPPGPGAVTMGGLLRFVPYFVVRSLRGGFDVARRGPVRRGGDVGLPVTPAAATGYGRPSRRCPGWGSRHGSLSMPRTPRRLHLSYSPLRHTMSESDSPATEHLWFLDTLVTVHVSERQGSDGVSVLEHRAPHADSAPLHLHRTEDEIFHILEGEIRFRMEDGERRLTGGDIVLVPRGVPHTYRVESLGGARWLTITARGDFERFVRSLGRVADRAEIPTATEHTPEMEEALEAAAREHGIEIVGPPLE
jgi:mannose-6-phosphate isomerase-like protein (cupin superfamily)